jgi:hypothetical protein
LLVNNVPFQATQKELVKLFGSFGQLRTVWLPKKFDGTHQGFAFVEYLASKDAVDFVCQIQFVDGEVQKEGPDTAKIGGGATNDGPSWHELQPLFMLYMLFSCLELLF